MSASAAARAFPSRGGARPPKMARVSDGTATTAPSVDASRGANARDRFRGGAAGRRRRSSSAASLDDASPSTSTTTSEPLQDLTRPGLTPWQVLGVANADDCTVAEVKAAYRARMKQYHPDVYRGEGDGAALARRIVAAYSAVVEDNNAARDAVVDAWDGVSEVFPWAREDADPFQHPEGPADAVFVNAFDCRGRGACPSYCCCVQRCAGSFSWVEDTNAARFDGPTWTELTRRQESQDAETAKASEADAYVLNLAVGQCPTMAIHWVTPRQRRRLDGIVAAVAEVRNYFYFLFF